MVKFLMGWDECGILVMSDHTPSKDIGNVGLEGVR